MIKLFSFEYESDTHYGVAEWRPNDQRRPNLYQITLRDGELYIMQVTGITKRWVQLDQNFRPQEFIQAIGQGLEETGVVISKWKVWRYYFTNLILKITSC